MVRRPFSAIFFVPMAVSLATATPDSAPSDIAEVCTRRPYECYTGIHLGEVGDYRVFQLEVSPDSKPTTSGTANTSDAGQQGPDEVGRVHEVWMARLASLWPWSKPVAESSGTREKAGEGLSPKDATDEKSTTTESRPSGSKPELQEGESAQTAVGDVSNTGEEQKDRVIRVLPAGNIASVDINFRRRTDDSNPWPPGGGVAQILKAVESNGVETTAKLSALSTTVSELGVAQAVKEMEATRADIKEELSASNTTVSEKLDRNADAIERHAARTTISLSEMEPKLKEHMSEAVDSGVSQTTIVVKAESKGLVDLFKSGSTDLVTRVNATGQAIEELKESFSAVEGGTLARTERAIGNEADRTRTAVSEVKAAFLRRLDSVRGRLEDVGEQNTARIEKAIGSEGILTRSALREEVKSVEEGLRTHGVVVKESVSEVLTSVNETTRKETETTREELREHVRTMKEELKTAKALIEETGADAVDDVRELLDTDAEQIKTSISANRAALQVQMVANSDGVVERTVAALGREGQRTRDVVRQRMEVLETQVNYLSQDIAGSHSEMTRSSHDHVRKQADETRTMVRKNSESILTQSRFY